MQTRGIGDFLLELRAADRSRPSRATPVTTAGDREDFAGAMRRQVEGQSRATDTAEAASLRTRRTPFDVLPASTNSPIVIQSARPEQGAGQVSASGAPRIVLNTRPACDPRIYGGPGAYNPYFCTPASPHREGKVVGFENWFQSIQMGGEAGFTWPEAYSANAEGAQEALRLVQQHVPDARIEQFVYVDQIGSTPSHDIVLPNGERMNAGLILDSYYHQGFGVDWLSDASLAVEIDILNGARPTEAAWDLSSYLEQQ